MNKLPNSIKWLIIVVTLAVLALIAFAVNDRASRVQMPAPDNTFGVYRTAESGASSDK